MTNQRRRRIVRRAVMALAVVVLMVSGYVSSYLGIAWAYYTGRVRSDDGTRALLQGIYAPADKYADSDLPLSAEMYAFRWWLCIDGRSTFDNIYESVVQSKAERERLGLKLRRDPTFWP